MIVLNKLPFSYFVRASKRSLRYMINVSASTETQWASLFLKISTSLLLVLQCLISINQFPGGVASIDVAVAFYNNLIFLLLCYPPII
jgi:hypothetical protein